MKLYYAPISTYSQKALIALYEKQLPFERELVDLMSAAGRAAYEGVYALGKVPLLQLDDGTLLPESSIIVETVDALASAKGTRLVPAEGAAAREVRLADRQCDLYLNDAAVTLLFQKIGFRKYDEATLAAATKQLRWIYESLDRRLASQDWLCAGGFSMADCAAIPPLFYAQHVAPFSDHAHLTAYFARAQRRDSYARVQAEFMPIWQAMQQPRG